MIREIKYFFITGYPRSRTAWLANMLTYANSFCYHDGLGQCVRVSDLAHLFLSASDDLTINRIGNSDSGLSFVWKEVNEYFPEANWIIIRRPKEDCKTSFSNEFVGRSGGYAGIRSIDASSVAPVFDQIESNLEALVSGIPAFRLMQVSYNDLNDQEVCRKIWRKLVSGTSFNVKRWQILDSVKVTVIPSKFNHVHSVREPEHSVVQ